MFRLWIALSLLSGVSSLVCPIALGFDRFKDGGDGSCYSDLSTGSSRTEFYRDCASVSSYLPFVMNAFQNSLAQQKNINGTEYGEKPPGLWLGLICKESWLSSCVWDDGTPLTSTSYSNFDLGYPNATVGPCVYQNATTGRWRSESCDTRFNLGTFCKFTVTNSVPVCSAANKTVDPQPIEYPDYYDGYCYNGYATNNIDDAENICSRTCGQVVSIHSEGENSFVRDLLISYGYTLGYIYANYPSGFIGIRGNSSQWFDGTAINYTNYARPPDTSPNSCSFLAINASQTPAGFWYTADCYQLQSTYMICKKAVLNQCDVPFVPFPTRAPPKCNGTQYLGTNGTAYAPGYPYYPYGQQPNTCEYVQKVQEGLYPKMQVDFVITSNFFPNVTISKFEFYSSEDPNDKPFYTFSGYSYYMPAIVSPTNVLRAVYTTKGDPNNTYDWYYMIYSTSKRPPLS